MCGRYSIGSEIQALAKEYHLKLPEKFTATYNAAPSQRLPVVDNLRPKEILMHQWGILPFWAKDESKRLINARSETIAEKTTFKKSFQRRRCLVAADGYYEWMKTPEGKIPYRICLKNHKPFFFAGIWDTEKEGGTKDFAIITTTASDSIAEIHKRMPVILHESAVDFWLSDTEDELGLLDVLRPFEDQQLTAFQVSQKVNWVGNNEESLREAVS